MRDPILDRAVGFCAILARSRSTGSRLNDKPDIRSIEILKEKSKQIDYNVYHDGSKAILEELNADVESSGDESE